MAGPVDLDWSDDALADLDRFAAFLQDQSPELAAIVAKEIIARSQLLCEPDAVGASSDTRQCDTAAVSALTAEAESHDERRAIAPTAKWDRTDQRSPIALTIVSAIAPA